MPAPLLDPRATPDAEVLVLAGRHDHTVDYRSQIALASRYRRGTLFLADDDHVLHALNASGSMRDLVATFFVHGPGSEELEDLFAELAPLRWSEWR